ncbi:OLC1v1036876C1 [Oldenlandia corymbosa var. corymbosa]|uniref:Germin-like protein n=1 Tax=Oldenlandia corymbosa var. corymbosa TaxID=529605 RepID=A0AAV1D005_OLDCO|nr:OLC1v1036876C1 [Oldenlandia corymbosa var. corymbosa]
MNKFSIIFRGFLALTYYIYFTLASDPCSLQDFCVADVKSPVLLNGVTCKDPKLVTAEDFFFRGLHKPGNTSNPFGSKVTPVSVAVLPGLNTLGVSMARIDFAPGAVNPPLIHPRATGLLTVLKGTLKVGFITSSPENRLFTKILRKGDAFVFPQGLVHFHQNVGKTNAVALAALGSQNPGTITIGNALFGSNPPIDDEVLAKAFRIDKGLVDEFQSKFSAQQ